jgi:hypothetical protein
MLTFNSKIVSIGALCLLCYVVYQRYQDSKWSSNNQYPKEITAAHPLPSKYTVVVPKDKKYQDYNTLEKLLYYFHTTDAPKIEQ